MPTKLAAAIFRTHVFVSFVLGGLLWAAGSTPGLDGATQWSFDLLKWPIDGDPGAINEGGRLMSAIGGGVLTALGVFNLLLVAPAIEAGERRILNAALLSTGCWFVIDSTGSIAAGAASNAGFNVLIFALYALPILLARRPS